MLLWISHAANRNRRNFNVPALLMLQLKSFKQDNSREGTVEMKEVTEAVCKKFGTMIIGTLLSK